jgi:hypothetical protein
LVHLRLTALPSGRVENLDLRQPAAWRGTPVERCVRKAASTWLLPARESAERIDVRQAVRVDD